MILYTIFIYYIPQVATFDKCDNQGPVVQRPISANPGLNFNPGFLFLLFINIFQDNFLHSFYSNQSSYYRHI